MSQGQIRENSGGLISSAIPAAAIPAHASAAVARWTALSGSSTGSRPPCRRSSRTRTHGAVSTSTA